MSNPGSRILIVDDEPSVRMTLELALADTAHHVESVETAELALKALSQASFDLMIVDKNLPGMNGAELIKKVRLTHDEEVWAAMITGYPSADSAMEMLHLGVRGYLEKPFEDVYAVVKRVDQILDQKRAGDRMKRITARLREAAHLVPTTRGLKIVVAAADSNDRKWLLPRTGSGMDSVVGASSLNEALVLVQTHAPDVIICDGLLRDLDLFTFVNTVRELAPATTFAVISDSPSLRMLTQLIDARIAAVIQRPLSETSYRARVDGLLMQLRAVAAPHPPPPTTHA